MPRFSNNNVIIIVPSIVLGTSQLTILSFLTWGRKGIYNSQVTKPSYKTELRIMTSQTELINVKFYLFKKHFEKISKKIQFKISELTLRIQS